jgi:hypothetical protein
MLGRLLCAIGIHDFRDLGRYHKCRRSHCRKYKHEAILYRLMDTPE